MTSSMISRSEQLKFLGNDVTILDTLFANGEDEVLTIPGRYMPDGEPFNISLKGVDQITGELRKQMVETVRSQWYARDEQQNAEKASDAEASTVDSGGGDSAASDGAGSSAPASSAVQEPQEGLAEYFERRKADIEGELREVQREIEGLRKIEDRLIKAQEEIHTCINALLTVSPPTSSE